MSGVEFWSGHANNLRVKKFLHQSWFFVSLCFGIVFGMILVLVFRWNFFASPLWFLVAFLVFAYAYIHPARAFLLAVFVAGMIIGFVRAVPSLDGVATTIDQWDFVVVIRDWFSARIQNAIPEPESKLGVAYLLGIKDGLPDELNSAIKDIGLAHIVVASGAHLSILVDVCRKIFGKISRFAGLLFSIIFIVFFMVMVGWTPSILRAGIMSILTLSMWYVGRKFEPWRIILIAMTATLLIDPTFLTNLGWLLSFSSFIGVMILGPALQRFLYGKTKPIFVASTILITIAATLATLPITLYYFGSISLIAVVANLLILPTLPFVMGLVFLSGIFPFVGFLATWGLDFHIIVINFFAEQSYFIIKIPERNPWIFLLYIPILLPFLISWCQKLKLRRKLDY